ncbi:MAG: hypothetical protein Q8Q49_03185 [bacterium]|nr:hypothetical protein [bacterium]
MARNLLFIVLSSLLICIVFSNQLFSSATFSSGDWPYFFQEAAKEFPVGFVYYKGYVGLGQGSLVFTGLESYYESFGNLFAAAYGWRAFEVFFFVLPLLVILFISSYLFTRSFIGVLVFTLNTYILMIIGGGQFGVAFAYALTPAVIYGFFRLIDNNSYGKVGNRAFMRTLALTSLTFGAQISIDIRIALLTSIAVGLYILFCFLLAVAKKMKTLLSVSFASFLAILLNAYWILPMVRFRVGLGEHGNPVDFLPGIVDFLSFSDFSHALSLLHPNWPENIFGKVYFLQPEFLLLPLFAFFSLFLVTSTGRRGLRSDGGKRSIVFFSLLALLSAFLAKGTAEPFGNIYKFLYVSVPGFVMFRDPTKFYILTALSYSFLIPHSLSFMTSMLKKYPFRPGVSKILSFLPSVLFVCLLFLLIRQVFFGGLFGTFQPHPVPKEYVALKNFIANQDEFFRILYVPSQSRFGYTSVTKPGLSAGLVFRGASQSAVVSVLTSKEGIRRLQTDAVKYVIVPTDPLSEIFLKERKYDERLRQGFITDLTQSKSLPRLPNIGELAVFAVPSPMPHFSINNPEASVSFVRSEESLVVNYPLSVRNVKAGDSLIFSEGYSHLWQLRAGKDVLSPQNENGVMRFRFAKNGTYNVELVYLPSENQAGIAISLIVLFVIVTVPIFQRLRVISFRHKNQ